MAAETLTTETVSHEPTIFAEPIFNIGTFPVTNSLISSWIAVILIVIVSIAIRRKISRIPRGIQNYAEVLLEGALSVADSVTGDRYKSKRFLPLALAFFLFILVSNWLGLIPGVGSIGFNQVHDGHAVFVPLLRGTTADLNATLALAIVAVVATHVFGIMFTSAWSHFNRFINLQALMAIPREIRRKNYTAILVNPITFFVGLIEIIGEIAKTASLSFRLFGNVFAGEVLLASMAVILAYVLPIPFVFMEIMVGLIQALIFAMLTLVFLTIMTTSHGHEEGVH